MFFNRNQRIKTEPRLPGQPQDDLRDNKRRVKIKNIRFSVDHEAMRNINRLKIAQLTQDQVLEFQRSSKMGQKRISFTDKLPEIVLQTREEQREVGREIRQVSVQHKKKDILLNSILEILKPNINAHPKPSEKPLFHPKLFRDWRIETSNKEYINQFVEELPHFNSTKHYRAPKVLENQILKAKNNPNIVRRKIFSQDKEREKTEKSMEEDRRPQGDLEKIQIITFSNKFPGLKKDTTHLRLHE